MAILEEIYSISNPRVGDAQPKELVLTGWSNAPAFMEQGRLYWRAVSNTGLFELSRKSGFAAGDIVSTGTISSEIVTLVAANTSGITGTATIPTFTTLSTGDVIITYAVEDDLKSFMQSVATLLTGSNQWEDEVRFEKALKQTKRDLDEIILAQIQTLLLHKDTTLEHMLADIATPRQFATTHALMTLALLEENRSNLHPGSLDMAEHYQSRAERAVKKVKVRIDYQLDGTIDQEASMTSGFIGRG